jgi:hypothetical protein
MLYSFTQKENVVEKQYKQWGCQNQKRYRIGTSTVPYKIKISDVHLGVRKTVEHNRKRFKTRHESPKVLFPLILTSSVSWWKARVVLVC